MEGRNEARKKEGSNEGRKQRTNKGSREKTKKGHAHTPSSQEPVEAWPGDRRD